MKKIIASIGANSGLACKKFYPNYQAIVLPSFFDIFLQVEKGEIDYGIIPLENSYAGRVSEIHNLLQDSDVTIIAEHFYAVEHDLCGVTDADISSIKEVFSHPQALLQCRKNLKKLNQHWQMHEYANTEEAAKYIKACGDKSKAAICSKIIANENNLKILASNIGDAGSDNVTIFITIAKKPKELDCKNGKIITTLLFTVKNVQGALYNALGCFANNNIDMIKLESYIPGGNSSQANFLISLAADLKEDRLKSALKELQNFSQKVKVLGSYYADLARD